MASGHRRRKVSYHGGGCFYDVWPAIDYFLGKVLEFPQSPTTRWERQTKHLKVVLEKMVTMARLTLLLALQWY